MSSRPGHGGASLRGHSPGGSGNRGDAWGRTRPCGVACALITALQLLPAAGGSTTPADGQIPLTNAAGANFASVAVQSDGSVVASYADGTTSTVGKLALASFVSPTGLLQMGNQDWQTTGLSGAASYNAPGTGGTGSILSGSLEQSNVNVSNQLVSLITAQQYYQANSKAISTSNQTITDILNAIQG